MAVRLSEPAPSPQVLGVSGEAAGDDMFPGLTAGTVSAGITVTLSLGV